MLISGYPGPSVGVNSVVLSSCAVSGLCIVSFGCVVSRSVEVSISFVVLVVESLIWLVVCPLAVVVVSSALLV